MFEYPQDDPSVVQKVSRISSSGMFKNFKKHTWNNCIIEEEKRVSLLGGSFYIYIGIIYSIDCVDDLLMKDVAFNAIYSL